MAYLAVDVGLLALVFIVFDTAHALDDEGGLLPVGKVDGQVAVGLDGYLGFVDVDAPDGFHTLLGGQ